MTTPKDLLSRFNDFIKKHKLLNEGDRVLLAVSGGMDSMVMADLFLHAPYSVAIAHCNFQLRGPDANKDEAFVKAFAEKHRLDFFSKKFDTASYVRQHKLSIQMAARELRYAFLESIRKQEGFNAVATAHHIDDAIETLFINIIRGTGINGLKGIPIKNNSVIRPLLFATKDDFRKYASEKKLRYRIDESNKDEKYLRNKVRQRLIPDMKEINPSLNKSMQVFFEQMEAVSDIYQRAISVHKKQCLRYYRDETHLFIKPLLLIPHAETILFELLKEYGFSAAQCHDIFKALGSQAGKRFFSASHCLIKDRDYLIIIPVVKDKEGVHEHHIHPETKSIICIESVFRFETGDFDDDTELPENALTLLADYDRLSFPLSLGPWQPGDRIQPMGMAGHKKISDILIDKKIPLNKKNDILVLSSGGQVIWVPGIRASEKFKITKKTKKYFKAVML